MGIWIMQSDYLDTVMDMVADADNVLEIGGWLGGFTLMVDEALQDGKAEILTYENNYDMPFRFPKKTVTAKTHFPWSKFVHEVDLREKDIFEDIPKAAYFIQREGKTVVFCDGGDKIREFDILSSYLKSGDVICTHDYFLNLEVYSDMVKSGVWKTKKKTPQVVYEDIRPFVEREGLVPDESIDPKSIWGVFKKP